MNDVIVTIDHIKQRARDAFIRGAKRHEHGMNWHALALPVWLAEWDRCNEFAVSGGDIGSGQP